MNWLFEHMPVVLIHIRLWSDYTVYYSLSSYVGVSVCIRLLVEKSLGLISKFL